jgi:hypothetical protein
MHYRYFDARTLPVFRAAAACIVPAEPGSAGGDDPACLLLADQMISGRPAGDRRLLTVFLRVLEWLPLLRYGRRFSGLSPVRQAAVLRFLEQNRFVPRLRAGFFGLKNFVLLGYYGHDAAHAELGYPGPRLDAPYYAPHYPKDEERTQ